VHIHGEDVVLFLHIFAAIVTFGVAGVLLLSLAQLKAATDIGTVRIWARISARTGPIFPILVLILIGLGGWLIGISDSKFSWSDGWVLTSVITLVLMEAYGGLVMAPADKKLSAAVNSMPDGPVPAEIRHEVLNPMVWAGAYGNTGAALGILFTMPTKPTGAGAIIIVGGAALIGIVIGLRLATAEAKAPRVPA
jgi:hypothetical protein